MTTTLKPHDFYLKLAQFSDRYTANSGNENYDEELEYVLLVLNNWDKWRFAETNELSFGYLRDWAIDNAPDAGLMKEVVGLIDSHVEENLVSLFPAHGTNIRKTIGMPEPVEEPPVAK
jgi:hypothetical protein